MLSNDSKRSFVSLFLVGAVLMFMGVGSEVALAEPVARPPADHPAPTSSRPSTPPANASAGAVSASTGVPASRPPMTNGHDGGGPAVNSGSARSGYNPGANNGGSGYNPGTNNGGSGYNPGTHSGRPDYSQGGGHHSNGAWNGLTGDGWNPGNYYNQSVIRGWMRLGSATAGKNPDKDIIQAYGSYRYSRVKLCVRMADVGFYDAQVQFVYGGRQDIRVQSRVKKGQCTREYYLRGGQRLDIRYVYLFFRQADNILNWRTAQVDLYAR